MNSSFHDPIIPMASLVRTLQLPAAESVAARFQDTFDTDVVPRRDEIGEILDMRQLRHQTKNALQRILGVLMATPEDAGSEWVEGVSRRIRLSAQISNALFGLTQTPGPMQNRLQTLADAVSALMADPGQKIEVQVLVEGDCPLMLRGAVVQVAHEFISNAVRHGFLASSKGTIRVVLSCRPDSQIRLLVSDDGRGFDVKSTPGEGMDIASALALRLGGTVTLRRRGWTEAELVFPARLGGWSPQS